MAVQPATFQPVLMLSASSILSLCTTMFVCPVETAPTPFFPRVWEKNPSNPASLRATLERK